MAGLYVTVIFLPFVVANAAKTEVSLAFRSETQV